MCVTTERARLARTIVYAGLAERSGKPVHVMGYQNQAENLAGGPNCMILHIPSAAPMSPDNMVDTSDCPSVLEDLADAAQPLIYPMSMSLDFSMEAPVVHVFQKGIYTVVLANRWDLVQGALAQVPEHKRPAIDTELLRFYGEHFTGWHLALCCFDNREAVKSTPLLWWFEPLFPETLMAPGIDGHDGHIPQLVAMAAERDHTVVVGTGEQTPTGDLTEIQWNPFKYTDEVLELLPHKALSQTFDGLGDNGDFLFDVEALRQGEVHIRVGILRRIINPGEDVLSRRIINPGEDVWGLVVG